MIKCVYLFSIFYVKYQFNNYIEYELNNTPTKGDGKCRKSPWEIKRYGRKPAKPSQGFCSAMALPIPIPAEEGALASTVG